MVCSAADDLYWDPGHTLFPSRLLNHLPRALLTGEKYVSLSVLQTGFIFILCLFLREFIGTHVFPAVLSASCRDLFGEAGL